MKTLKEIIAQEEIKIDHLPSNITLEGTEIRCSFKITFDNKLFFAVASNTHHYDHLSVTFTNKTFPNIPRCPRWHEMCIIKDLFFNKNEIAIQYHPVETEYVNIHSFCLHLWRPQKETIPIPPKWMV